MRIVLDTNVFVSGVFFTGPPYSILDAWRNGTLQIVISPSIFREYHRVAEKLSASYPEIDLSGFLTLLLSKAEMADDGELPSQVCVDADDDKFLACAVANSVPYIISGDKHLLDISEYQTVKILKPRGFVDRFL